MPTAYTDSPSIKSISSPGPPAGPSAPAGVCGFWCCLCLDCRPPYDPRKGAASEIGRGRQAIGSTPCRRRPPDAGFAEVDLESISRVGYDYGEAFRASNASILAAAHRTRRTSANGWRRNFESLHQRDRRCRSLAHGQGHAPAIHAPGGPEMLKSARTRRWRPTEAGQGLLLDEIAG